MVRCHYALERISDYDVVFLEKAISVAYLVKLPVFKLYVPVINVVPLISTTNENYPRPNGDSRSPRSH